MIFIDANIFLRAILQDDREKAKDCLKLLGRVDRGELEAASSVLVLNEILWVLEGLGVGRQEIVKRLKTIATSNVKILDGGSASGVMESLSWYEELGVDFIDALNSYTARENGIRRIISYDEHFDRMEFIERIEPQMA